MTSPLRHIVLALIVAITLGIIAWAVARHAAPSAYAELRIATWNLEWLVSPNSALAARVDCRARRRASLPCDVARSLARDSADFRAIAAQARRLDADVIAFQEVENAAVARRVFRGYDICIAPGEGMQHAGFAIRRGIAARCEAPLQELTAGGRGRPGQPLTLLPPGVRPVELLAVHLKSGCANDPLDSSSAACVLLAAQGRALGEWIAPRAAAGSSFIVLGDFNRAGAPSPDDAFWAELGSASFEAAATHLPFRNCVFGSPYRAFIDHILLSQDLVPQLHPRGFQQLRFDPAAATRFRLPDHCPVSVSLSLTPAV